MRPKAVFCHPQAKKDFKDFDFNLLILTFPLPKYYLIAMKTLITASLMLISAFTVANARQYLAQVYIDTTVLRAMITLNEASVHYSINSDRQVQAVMRAQDILNRLKQEAKGDPNEAYALSRISEIEYQIHLEMEEIRQLAADRRVMAANQLVAQYNAEVAKSRPDFAMMRALFRRMAEVDQRQANNLADSYNRRHRAISREAQHALERALAANDFETARRELEYCEKNMRYLVISPTHLAAQRERLEQLESAHTELPRVVAMLDAGERAYKEFRLSEARMELTRANNRLAPIRANLPPREASAVTARTNRLLSALDSREDSLVRVAKAILEKQGPDEAMRYLQEELQRRMNLSHDKAAAVDRAIMQARPNQDISLGSAVETIEATAARGDGAELVVVQDAARRRAQLRADSLKTERNKASDIAANIYALIESKRSRDAVRLFNREKAFLASAMDKGAYEALELSVTHSARSGGTVQQADKGRLRAEQTQTMIYEHIERNEIARAHKLFRKNRKHLVRHLDRETFQMLELTVTQSYIMSKR